MSKVKLQLEVDRALALKLPTYREKVENGGDMLVIGDGIRGEIINLVLVWLDSNSMDTQDMVVELALKQGITTLVELSNAAFRLELVPLLKSCSKTIAGIVENKSLVEVRQLLKLDDDHGVKPSLDCIQGVLKCLPIEKRLELDQIELQEWQMASYRVWKEQEVLFFGKPCNINCDQCDMINISPNEFNMLSYSRLELKVNKTNITGPNRQRKLPTRFVEVVKKCNNLKTIAWDDGFGEMASFELAIALKEHCHQLEHVQGTVITEFECYDKGEKYIICPASFFKPTQTITCYKVDLFNIILTTLTTKIAKKRKTFQENEDEIRDSFVGQYRRRKMWISKQDVLINETVADKKLCSDAFKKNICTNQIDAVEDEEPFYQHLYDCRTCWPRKKDDDEDDKDQDEDEQTDEDEDEDEDERAICAVCIRKCHNGHNVRHREYVKAKSNCKCADNKNGRCCLVQVVG